MRNEEEKQNNDLDYFRNKLSNRTSNQEQPPVEVEPEEVQEVEEVAMDLKSMRSEMKRNKEGNGDNPISSTSEGFVFEDLQAEIEKNTAEKNALKSEEENPIEEVSEEDAKQLEEERLALMKKFFPDGTYEEDRPTMTVGELKEQKNEEVKVTAKKKSNKMLLILIAVVPTAILMFVVVFLVAALLTTSKDTPTDTADLNSIPTEQIEEGAELSVSEAQAILEGAKKEADLVTVELDEDGVPKQTISSNIIDETKLGTDAFDLTEIDDGRISKNEIGDYTFADPSSGLSLTYPGKWNEVYGFTAKERPINVNNVVLIGSDPSVSKADNMRISIEATQQSVSAKEYFDKTVDLFAENFDEYQLISSGEKTISGGEAMYRVYSWSTKETVPEVRSSKDRITQYQVYIAGQEKMHVITFTSMSDKFDRNYDTYEEILSTIHVNRR